MSERLLLLVILILGLVSVFVLAYAVHQSVGGLLEFFEIL